MGFVGFIFIGAIILSLLGYNILSGIFSVFRFLFIDVFLNVAIFIVTFLFSYVITIFLSMVAGLLGGKDR